MRKILYLFCVAIFAFSCAKDDSTMVYPDQNPNFSKITIKSEEKTLSVDFGEAFNFTPEVTQTVSSKALSYKWIANEITGSGAGNSFEVGNELTFKHTFEKSGTFRVRLEAKNEDYSVFSSWEADVRIYDEGRYVVSCDENGVSSFAFARKLSEKEESSGVKLTFITDLLKKVNPDVEIKNIFKVQKKITSYKDPTPIILVYSADAIYAIRPNTFEILNTAKIADFFPGEKMIDACATDNSVFSLIFTEKGNTYEFGNVEFLFAKPVLLGNMFNGFEKVYSNLLWQQGGNMMVDMAWVTNSPEPKLWLPCFSYASPSKPINNTSGLKSPYNDNERDNEFLGRRILGATRMNGNSLTQNANLYAISVDRTNNKNVLIVEYSAPDNVQGVGARPHVSTKTIEYISDKDVTFTEKSVIQPNVRYNWICYSNGSKIYCWYPRNVSPNDRLPSNAAIDLGAGKEVTAMAVSYNTKELYVAFYDSSRSGDLKGGLYIYDAKDIGIVTNLQPKEKFEGITTRPVQVGYKAKGPGVYVTEGN